MMPRRSWLFWTAFWASTSVSQALTAPGRAEQVPPLAQSQNNNQNNLVPMGPCWVGYQSWDLTVRAESIPVSCWFPVSADNGDAPDNHDANDAPSSPVTYDYRISLRKIGQLLARWDFIPAWVKKDYQLAPTHGRYVVDGTGRDYLATPINKNVKVLVLAHGYLGSRFDLSHLAEFLASHGYCCVAPEYPESLAASYDNAQGQLDRRIITDALLERILLERPQSKTSNNNPPIQYGIIGHSLGCGTALQTGTVDWTRVLISGFLRNGDKQELPPKLLFLSSRGDGLVPAGYYDNAGALPPALGQWTEESSAMPALAARIYTTPNHISFLSSGTNQAMIDFLSPLLPLAQLLKIPVLDFDKYQTSQDSDETAADYQPLVLAYLQQHMT